MVTSEEIAIKSKTSARDKANIISHFEMNLEKERKE